MTSACPTCGSSGTPVLFGLPEPSADEAAAEGLLILGGCLEPEGDPYWECGQGHAWSGDLAEWEVALNAALDGRPHCRVCGGQTRYLVYPGAEELFLDELARGDAELADAAGTATSHFGRVCRDCRATS